MSMEERNFLMPGDEVREAKKEKFLASMSHTNIVTASCESAGISRDTFYRWKDEGFITQAELNDSYARYLDLIRGELIKRGFVGTPKLIISNGRVVVDADGQPIMQNQIDSKILLEMAKKHLPEWKDARFEDEPEHEDGIPDRFRLTFDLRKLNKGQVAALRQIAQDIYDMEHGIIDASKVYPATMHEDRYRSN